MGTAGQTMGVRPPCIGQERSPLSGVSAPACPQNQICRPLEPLEKSDIKITKKPMNTRKSMERSADFRLLANIKEEKPFGVKRQNSCLTSDKDASDEEGNRKDESRVVDPPYPTMQLSNRKVRSWLQRVREENDGGESDGARQKHG